MANDDPNVHVAMIGLGVVGFARLLLNPGRSARVLAGGYWDQEEIDRRAAVDAARAAEADAFVAGVREQWEAHLRAARDQEWPSL